MVRCNLCFLQYTFILTASKQLPKQCTDYQSGKSKQRKSVGVRIPDDTVLQVICKLQNAFVHLGVMHHDVVHIMPQASNPPRLCKAAF